nr:hypothetical protein HannXRQ_Chr05g0155741 [Ipomoea batatas]
MVAFQWFLIEFSDRPGICFAISDHRFPSCSCTSTNSLSSSSLHDSFCKKSLTQKIRRKSKTPNGARPTILVAITLHRLSPYWFTNLIRSLHTCPIIWPLMKATPLEGRRSCSFSLLVS